MRAFVAIDLPDEAVAKLEEVQERIPAGRASDPETLHLTLAFLGDQSEAVLAEVHQELSAAAAAPFEIMLAGLGTFGGRSPANCHVEVAATPQLSALQASVVAAIRRAGVALERRRFRPHVTIARFRQRLHRDELFRLRLFLEDHGGLRIGPVPVTAFTLYRSTLGPGGARHDALAVYPLDT